MNEYGKQVKKTMDTYMNNPDSIDKEISDIQNATHGVEVRGALAAGVKKSFTKSEEAIGVTQSLIDGAFDDAELVTEIESKLNQLEQDYAPKLTRVGRQTEEIEFGDRYDVSGKGRKPKTIISFTDDDGRSEVWDVLYPLIKELDIPFGLAITTSYIGTNNFLTLEQLKELYADPRIDILSHHYSGQMPLFDVATEKEAMQNLELAERDFRSWGIDDVYSIAYIQGRHSEVTRRVSSKFYRASLTTEQGINKVPYEQYALRRVGINGSQDPSSYPDSPITGYPRMSMDHFKAMVDLAEEEGGWLVFMTHVWYEYFDADELRELVGYIRSKGIPIVGVNEALNSTGNIIQVGDHYKTNSNPNPNAFVVGSDGTIPPTRNFANVIGKLPNTIDPSTKPNEFDLEQITVGIYSTTKDIDNITVDGKGMVITSSLGVTTGGGYVNWSYIYQIIIDKETGKMYTRTSNDDGTNWNNVFEETTKIIRYEDPNIFDKPLSEFPIGITYSRVTGSESTGFPNNEAGTLITVKMDDNPNIAKYSYQEYVTYTSGEKYLRKAVDGEVWETFKQITS